MVASPPIKVPARLQVTDEQFLQLTKANPDLRMERTAEGELIVMPPTGSEGGSYNAEMSADLVMWNRQARLGKVFDSSTGFTLPNGATRAPDPCVLPSCFSSSSPWIRVSDGRVLLRKE